MINNRIPTFIELDKDLKRAAKMRAHEEEIDFRELVEEAIKQYLVKKK